MTDADIDATLDRLDAIEVHRGFVAKIDFEPEDGSPTAPPPVPHIDMVEPVPNIDDIMIKLGARLMALRLSPAPEAYA